MREVLNYQFYYTNIEELKEKDLIAGWCNGSIVTTQIVKYEPQLHSTTYLITFENGKQIEIPGNWNLVLEGKKRSINIIPIGPEGKNIETIKFKKSYIFPDVRYTAKERDNNFKLGYLKGNMHFANFGFTPEGYLFMEHMEVHRETVFANQKYLKELFDHDVEPELIKGDDTKGPYMKYKGYYKTIIKDFNIKEILSLPADEQEELGYISNCFDIKGTTSAGAVKVTLNDKDLTDKMFLLFKKYGYDPKIAFKDRFKIYKDFIMYDVTIRGGRQSMLNFITEFSPHNSRKISKVLSTKRLENRLKIVKIETITNNVPKMFPKIITQHGYFNMGEILFRDNYYE